MRWYWIWYVKAYRQKAKELEENMILYADERILKTVAIYGKCQKRVAHQGYWALE